MAPMLLLKRFHTYGQQEDVHVFFTRLFNGGDFEPLFTGNCQPVLSCSLPSCLDSVAPDHAQELFTTLQLTLPQNQAASTTLQTLVDTWLTPELMPADTIWTCPNPSCMSRSPPTKRNTITQYPPILLIQLLRYRFNLQANTGEVNRTSVAASPTLTIGNRRYSLHAVVHFRGLTTQSGHYWTCVQHKHGSKDKWWHYNDVIRREASAGEPSVSRDAGGPAHGYLYFYTQQS
jgi:ubiquitin C-terminal hydrolase